MAGKFVQGNWLLPNNVNANKQSNYSLDFGIAPASSHINLGEELFSTLTSNFTISFWAKPTGTAALKDFMAFTFGNNSIFYNSFLLNFNSESIQFKINNTGVWELQFPTDADLTNFTAGWNHYVIVYTPGTTSTCKVYINNSSTSFSNGTLIANFSTAPTPNATTGFPLKIGNPSQYSSGCEMDEFSIFPRALSSGEVSSLYNSGTPGNPFDLSGNPIAYYKLGETAIGQAPGGTWNWQVPNHAQTQLAWQGLPQNAWDGGSGGGGQNLGTTHTISYWLNNNNHNNSSYNRAGWFGIYQATSSGGVKISGSNNFQSQGIIYGRGGSSSADGNMPVAGNYITYRTGSNSSSNNMQFPLGSINLQDNQTYNIIFVRDGGSVKCFINGQELQNPVGSINASFELIYQIISNYTFYGIQRGWGGIMTNVAIWKSDRESEVDNIYNNGEPQSNYTTAPDIWYKFDDTTTSYPSQYKRSINSSLSSESYVKSYLQQPFYNGAGGSHNYIYSTLDSDLNLGTSYSFSFWMGFRTDRENFYGYYNKYNVYYLGTNPSNTNVNGILEQDVYASQPNTGSNVNTLVFTLYDSNGNTATGLNLANGGTPSLNDAFDGQLHNYMFVKDGQTVSFYFDNQLVASSTMAGELSNTVLHNINGSDGGNTLARTNYTTSAEWSFFANKVLTASERATIYNSGEPGDISSTSPTIWYSYDNIDVTNEKLLDKGSASTNASILRRSGSNMNSGSSMFYIKYRDGVQSGTADLTSTDLGLHNPLYSQFSTLFNSNNFIIPDSPTTAVNNNSSISFWVKTNTTGNRHGILNKRDGGGQVYYVYVNTDNTIAIDGGGAHQFSTGTITQGEWAHVALTISSGSVIFYINGSSAGTGTVNLTADDAPTYLGSKTGGADPSNAYLSNVALFIDKTLSVSEVISIYNNGKPSDISSLLPTVWWKLGDAMYTNSSNKYLLIDSINGNNSTSVNDYAPSISADVPKVVAPGLVQA